MTLLYCICLLMGGGGGFGLRHTQCHTLCVANDACCLQVLDLGH